VDNKETNAKKATNFIRRFHIKLKLTTTCNAKCNGKNEKGHQLIVNVMVKVCNGKMLFLPNFLLLALMVSKRTYSSAIEYSPAEFISGQLPLMPIEHDIAIGKLLHETIVCCKKNFFCSRWSNLIQF
jgi:hypothetical protein